MISSHPDTNLGCARAPARATEGRLAHGVAVVPDVDRGAAHVVARVEVRQERVQVERGEREVDRAVVELVLERKDL